MLEEELKSQALEGLGVLGPDFGARVMRSLQAGGAVYSLVFSPDGTLLANDTLRQADPGLPRDDHEQKIVGEVELWNVRDGSLRRTLRTPHGNPHASVRFSPDGTLLASATGRDAEREGMAWDAEVWLWEVPGGEVRRVLEVPGAQIRTLALSPDGSSVAAGVTRWPGDPAGPYMVGSLRLWSTETGELLCEVEVGEGMVWALAYSPDGATVAVGTGRTGPEIEGQPFRDWVSSDVRLLDVSSGQSSGQVRHVLTRPHAESQSKIAWSPDGSVVASGDGPEGGILLWDAETGRVKRRLDGHTNRVFALAFSPDGALLASGSQDETVRLWDVRSGALKRTLTEHGTSVHALAFSADGTRLASADIDREVKVWTIA